MSTAQLIERLHTLRIQYRSELSDVKRKAARLKALEDELHELTGMVLPGQIEINANWEAILQAKTEERFKKEAVEMVLAFMRERE